ncbi:DUF5958 family protein [uncultured Chryseobacterium sp.]|jgi:hypothetical protein|uniref:DUF5958 family protein n=1 Tax=uncultured Chryseobacterium sp. TaxID=259322 RepID=UPI00263815D7|nr:DUF5958 family protein [uncultured Chryseobacterium sp.]
MIGIIDQIFINKYGQGLIDIEPLKKMFFNLNPSEKRKYLNGILFLILQSKPNNNDTDQAITISNLKPTYTPCVLLKKGVAQHQLEKIIMLTDNELNKVYILFMNLFKIAYFRRFLEEKNDPNKWWYWDLSDHTKENEILKRFL